MTCSKVQTVNEEALTSFQSRVACSPLKIHDLEKSRVKTIMLEVKL